MVLPVRTARTQRGKASGAELVCAALPPTVVRAMKWPVASGVRPMKAWRALAAVPSRIISPASADAFEFVSATSRARTSQFPDSVCDVNCNASLAPAVEMTPLPLTKYGPLTAPGTVFTTSGPALKSPRICASLSA